MMKTNGAIATDECVRNWSVCKPVQRVGRDIAIVKQSSSDVV